MEFLGCLPALLAVHIADGVLSPPWWEGGFVAAAFLMSSSGAATRMGLLTMLRRTPSGLKTKVASSKAARTVPSEPRRNVISEGLTA